MTTPEPESEDEAEQQEDIEPTEEPEPQTEETTQQTEGIPVTPVIPAPLISRVQSAQSDTETERNRLRDLQGTLRLSRPATPVVSNPASPAVLTTIPSFFSVRKTTGLPQGTSKQPEQQPTTQLTTQKKQHKKLSKFFTDLQYKFLRPDTRQAIMALVNETKDVGKPSLKGIPPTEPEHKNGYMQYLDMLMPITGP